MQAKRSRQMSKISSETLKEAITSEFQFQCAAIKMSLALGEIGL